MSIDTQPSSTQASPTHAGRIRAEPWAIVVAGDVARRDPAARQPRMNTCPWSWQTPGPGPGRLPRLSARACAGPVGNRAGDRVCELDQTAAERFRSSVPAKSNRRASPRSAASTPGTPPAAGADFVEPAVTQCIDFKLTAGLDAEAAVRRSSCAYGSGCGRHRSPR